MFDKFKFYSKGDASMIFISGVHGVGKSYFCKELKAATGIESYVSSKLIGEMKNVSFETDKKTGDIDDNQNYLLEAVEKLKELNPYFVLDGHFCLLDKEGTITRIPEQTFIDLQPEAIVLLTEDVEIIAKRRMDRDGIEIDLEETQKFQDAEITYATEIAQKLGVPIKISAESDDFQSIIDFIKEQR